jgi:hypothetical protein
MLPRPICPERVNRPRPGCDDCVRPRSPRPDASRYVLSQIIVATTRVVVSTARGARPQRRVPRERQTIAFVTPLPIALLTARGRFVLSQNVVATTRVVVITAAGRWVGPPPSTLLFVTSIFIKTAPIDGTKVKLARGSRYADLLSNARSGARCDTVNCFCWL